MRSPFAENINMPFYPSIMQATTTMKLIFMLTSILAGSTVENMDDEMRNWFDDIIQVGYKHEISKDAPHLIMFNYGFLIEEIFKCLTTPKYCPSLEYLSTRVLVTSLTLKKFIYELLKKGIIPSYKVKLDVNEYRMSTCIESELFIESNNNITNLIIGSTLKAYERNKDCEVSLEGIERFRISIVFLQLLMVLCKDHDGLDKLKKLTMNVENDGYGVTNWVVRWKMSSEITTSTESWNLVTEAIKDLDYAPWLYTNLPIRAYENDYNALELNNSTLFEDLQAFVGASDSSDSDDD